MSEEEDNVSGAPETEADAEKSSGRRLSDADYIVACEAYELGTKGIVELAEQYNISRQALWKRFSNDGIKKGSRAHELKQAVSQAAHQKAVQQATRAEKWAEKRLDWIEETRVSTYNALKQSQIMAVKTVIEAHKNGQSPAVIDDDLKAIRRYQAILIENADARLNVVLDADKITDETLIPSLIIEDLTADDIVNHHRDIGALDDDTDVDDLLKSIDGNLESGE